MIAYTEATAIFWLIVPIIILVVRGIRARLNDPERYFRKMAKKR